MLASLYNGNVHIWNYESQVWTCCLTNRGPDMDGVLFVVSHGLGVNMDGGLFVVCDVVRYFFLSCLHANCHGFFSVCRDASIHVHFCAHVL